jgi:hypothetical protein
VAEHALFGDLHAVVFGFADRADVNGVEIDRMKFSGKFQSKDGYRRAYKGKPGLTAQLVSGPGRIGLQASFASGLIPAV